MDWISITYLFVLPVVMIGLSVAVGIYADRKGYPFSPCFLLSIVLTPIPAFLIMVILPEQKKAPKPLPLEMILAIEQEKARRLAAAPESAS